jgi:FKBP12-rapamycin complex-associated protein
MEVSNIEGSFRITCENVMRVLRDNKESLMAVLEAVSATPLSEVFSLTIVVHSRSTPELASYGGYFTSRSQLPL